MGSNGANRAQIGVKSGPKSTKQDQHEFWNSTNIGAAQKLGQPVHHGPAAARSTGGSAWTGNGADPPAPPLLLRRLAPASAPLRPAPASPAPASRGRIRRRRALRAGVSHRHRSAPPLLPFSSDGHQTHHSSSGEPPMASRGEIRCRRAPSRRQRFFSPSSPSPAPKPAAPPSSSARRLRPPLLLSGLRPPPATPRLPFSSGKLPSTPSGVLPSALLRRDQESNRGRRVEHPTAQIKSRDPTIRIHPDLMRIRVLHA